ncbi:MAG: replication-relaxation family protein [Anaerolinea sp.]|nr:replication-relaxation family protein [Anaerolinea sp.]
MLKWQGENDLKKDYDYVSIRNDSGRLKDVSVIPDSYFALQTPRGVTHAFLELDRGKMTVGKFKTKILAYQVYYDSGAYTRRFGTRSLRVLTVTLGQGRLQNLRRATEEADGKQRFWFTCLEQIRPETVLCAPIWQVATNSALQPLVELQPLSTG